MATMTTTRRTTTNVEPLTPPYDARRRSSPILPHEPFASLNTASVRYSRAPVVLSPPPTPRPPPRPRLGSNSGLATAAKSSPNNKGGGGGTTTAAAAASAAAFRLRSNSGLSFHTNEDALRQYTDYNPDGSPRKSLFGPILWQPQSSSSSSGLDSNSTVAGGKDGAAAAAARGWGYAAAGSGAAVGLGLPTSPPAEYRRSMLPEYAPAGSLPIPDFFGREVFNMVLRNPTTSHLLWQFAQSKGCGEAVEFLIKVQEYSNQVSQLTQLLAVISTNYTSITASSPVNLPSQLGKSLNTDVKHLSSSLLPGLDAVFLESRTCIEQRVAREIYPDFVRHQLTLATSVSLASEVPAASSTSAHQRHQRQHYYPGLGDCFCLTDAMAHDNPIEFASDGFVTVTGYRRSEVVGRNCRFLQGPMTDRTAVTRLRESVRAGQESVELVLNYREDGAPFWNLLYVCPLADARGRVRYFLGAQVNVSETIGSHKDVLRILHFGASSSPTFDVAGVGGGRQVSSKDDQQDRPGSARTEKVTASRRPSTTGTMYSEVKTRNRDFLPSRAKSARRAKNFFKFRRAVASLTPSDGEDDQPPPMPTLPVSHHAATAAAAAMPGSPPASGSTASLVLETALTQRLGLDGQASLLRTAYSRFLLLRVAGKPGSPTAITHPGNSAAKKAGRLLIDYASPAALDTLGLARAADAIVHRDVFDVLAEQASCVSVTRTFKSSVRENVLREGRAATLDLVFNTVGVGGSVGGGGSSKGKGTRLVSYWTPVKDGVGEVAYVMLVVSPVL